MRKVLFLLAVMALVIAPVSAAQAKSTRYKVSVGFTLIGMRGSDLDVSYGHEHDKVRVHGKVKGGPVKGKRVYIYRVNLSVPGSKTKYVGSAKLSKHGAYSRVDRPSKGGIWRYTVVKKGSGRLARSERSRNLNVFQFGFVSEFPNSGATQVGTSVATTANGSDKGYYSDAFLISGDGSALTAATTGFRCKGFTMHIGIAKTSRTGGSYTVWKGSRALFTRAMSPGDPAHQTTDAERKSYAGGADGDFKISISGDKSTQFLVGIPKVACTHPSANND